MKIDKRHRRDDQRQHAVPQHRVDEQALEAAAEEQHRDGEADQHREPRTAAPIFMAASMKKAGSMTNSPCAKLIVCEVCQSSVKPIATSA